MKKKILFGVLVFVFISVLVFAGQIAGVSWNWNTGSDSITAKSTDGQKHVLSLAVTITNKGYSSCVNVDIDLSANGREVTWNVKQKIGSGATIDGVSVTGCK
jgi:hypothetical protein